MLSAAPASTIHDRNNEVFPLPAGADTTVTRPARLSRSNRPLRRTNVTGQRGVTDATALLTARSTADITARPVYGRAAPSPRETRTIMSPNSASHDAGHSALAPTPARPHGTNGLGSRPAARLGFAANAGPRRTHSRRLTGSALRRCPTCPLRTNRGSSPLWSARFCPATKCRHQRAEQLTAASGHDRSSLSDLWSAEHRACVAEIRGLPWIARGSSQRRAVPHYPVSATVFRFTARDWSARVFGCSSCFRAWGPARYAAGSRASARPVGRQLASCRTDGRTASSVSSSSRRCASPGAGGRTGCWVRVVAWR